MVGRMKVDVGERRGIGECGPFGPYIAEKRKSGKSGVECIGVYIISENVVARQFGDDGFCVVC